MNQRSLVQSRRAFVQHSGRAFASLATRTGLLAPKRTANERRPLPGGVFLRDVSTTPA
jgi:hypothetical protein